MSISLKAKKVSCDTFHLLERRTNILVLFSQRYLSPASKNNRLDIFLHESQLECFIGFEVYKRTIVVGGITLTISRPLSREG